MNNVLQTKKARSTTYLRHTSARNPEILSSRLAIRPQILPSAKSQPRLASHATRCLGRVLINSRLLSKGRAIPLLPNQLLGGAKVPRVHAWFRDRFLISAVGSKAI